MIIAHCKKLNDLLEYVWKLDNYLGKTKCGISPNEG